MNDAWSMLAWNQGAIEILMSGGIPLTIIKRLTVVGSFVSKRQAEPSTFYIYICWIRPLNVDGLSCIIKYNNDNSAGITSRYNSCPKVARPISKDGLGCISKSNENNDNFANGGQPLGSARCFVRTTWVVETISLLRSHVPENRSQSRVSERHSTGRSSWWVCLTRVVVLVAMRSRRQEL